MEMVKKSINDDLLLSSHKTIRIGMFGRYYPNYRLGVLNAISKMDGIDLNVHASFKPLPGFSLIEPSEASFSLLNTVVWHMCIPFLQNSIDIMPYSIWCVLCGKYDLFVLSNRIGAIGVWINLLFARLLGRRICLWGHGISKRDGRMIMKLRKIMMRLAHANILYSESGLDKAIELGLAPEKLFIAYNALDTRRSKAIRDGISSGDLERFRKENDLIDKKIVLFSGRLQERKKPEILVQAMQKIIHSVPDALAIIVGDGEMRRDLERLIKDLELESCVRLLGAVYDEEIMARYLLCSSVAVMPANAGLAIQHAFDYGVSVVVLVLQTTWALKAFDVIWVLTQGGPMDKTMVLNIFAYQQTFQFFNFGYGSAVGFLVLVLNVGLTILYLTIIGGFDN